MGFLSQSNNTEWADSGSFHNTEVIVLCLYSTPTYYGKQTTASRAQEAKTSQGLKAAWYRAHCAPIIVAQVAPLLSIIADKYTLKQSSEISFPLQREAPAFVFPGPLFLLKHFNGRPQHSRITDTIMVTPCRHMPCALCAVCGHGSLQSTGAIIISQALPHGTNKILASPLHWCHTTSENLP